MAVIALGHNGIGLGHVSRLMGLCESLVVAGVKPVLFAEGSGYSVIPHDFPSASVPRISDQTPQLRSEISRAISSLALLSFPSVLIEDTHPLSLEVANGVSRILVLRPIEWSQLKSLREYSEKFHSVLVADHPSSPTWPYNDRQTDEITSWNSWACVGPLYRRPLRSEIKDVKRRYRLTKGTRVCVFSMGGGGEHFGARDAVSFCRRARSIGNWLLAQGTSVRLVFVGGPLFDRYDLVPNMFTVVRDEPFMPALFAVADAAVIRPGFNSVWECIAGCTPIIPISGTSYIEPIARRVKNLESRGMAFTRIGACWSDGARARMSRAARVAGKRWNGRAGSEIIRSIVHRKNDPPLEHVGRSTNLLSEARPCISETGEEESCEADLRKLSDILCRKMVSVRIDDVTDLTGTTKILIELCEEFGLGVSLEIVPYFAQISCNNLQRCRIAGDLIEVSQHGYSHILRSYRPGPKSEFTFCEVAIEKEADEIAKGKAALEKRFPKEFHNGFSPPFDGTPMWLPECWAQLGGEYISVMEARPAGTRIPFVVNSVDVWNWTIGSRYSLSHIRREIISSIVRSGHAGLVLHPTHFSFPEDIRWLRNLFKWLQRGKVEFVMPSRRAQLQCSRVIESPFRRYSSLAAS